MGSTEVGTDGVIRCDWGNGSAEYAAYHDGDPTLMTPDQRRAVIQRFHDNGFYSSQLLLANTEDIASPDPAKRAATLDYMKRCGEFQLELGGRQVLICWGCGVHEPQMMPEQAWLNTVTSIREYAACRDTTRWAGPDTRPYRVRG